MSFGIIGCGTTGKVYAQDVEGFTASKRTALWMKE